MDNLIIQTFPVEPLGCNCSILICKNTKESIIIDPGGEAEKIISQLKEFGCKVQSILHTHAHFDHCLATYDVSKFILMDQSELTIGMHADDIPLYQQLPLQCQMFNLPPSYPNATINHFLEDNELVTFGEHSLNIIHTPGHTLGSCSFNLENNGILFSGDTLFQRSIGRTDLPGGNKDDILKSIKTRLFTLDQDTKVIPGHGPFTRIYEEKKENPFF